MKTTDLIPIILYQLIDGDKYGYEIIKQIEDVSNGGIVIKQPTLYSVLKKLEQGKFISSYWQDSEIGGKRHYYKLTDNGKAQLSTYPALQQLVSEAVGEEPAITPSAEVVAESNNLEADNDLDINIANNTETSITNYDNYAVSEDINTIKPITIDLTAPTGIISNEINTNTNLQNAVNEDIEIIKPIEDVATKIDNSLFSEPTDIDKLEPVANVDVEEPQLNNIEPKPINIFDAIEPETKSISIFDAMEYSSSDNQSTQPTLSKDEAEQTANEPLFTEKVENVSNQTVDNKLYENLTPNPEMVAGTEDNIKDASPMETIEEVKFLNYVNLSTDKTSIKRKKAVTKRIQKMILSSLTLLAILVLSLVLCNKYSFSKLYYVSVVIVGLILLLYPAIILSNISKLRLKYCTKPFRYSCSRDFFIKLSLFLSLVIAVFAYNLTIANSISEIFKTTNFANFVAPIMFGVMFLIDFVYGWICYKSYASKQ